jgi:DNA-binding transcriptional LysR family regulator
MNSLDALADAAKEDAGIVRAPSWPTEADLAAGHLVGLLADYEPTPVPLHRCFSRRGWPGRRSRASLDSLVERYAASVRLPHSPRGTINRITVQFLNRARWPWYTKPLINRVS